jgi:3-hydroxyisobutyrate dehydrogenase-like beta-hydroxyacid dehydrogenase
MATETAHPARSDPAKADLRTGIVGLGMIGRGIAVSLARRGRVSVVYDVRRDAADRLPGVRAVLGSPAEVASASDIVLVAVVDAAQVADVITGPNGILAGARSGLVVVVTSTIAVQVVRDMAEVCERSGVDLLDCAVKGGNRVAENGILALVGGPDDVVRRARPVIDDFAGRVFQCGPLGTGMATKLASAVVTAARWRAVHEAVALAAAAGAEPATLVEVIEASDPDGDALLGLQRLRMARQTVDAHSRPVRHYQRNMDKDVDAALALAAESGVVLPLVEVTRAQAADTFAWIEEAGA